MGASRYIGRVGALAVGLGVGAAILGGAASAWAAPDTDSAPGPAAARSASSATAGHSARQAGKPRPVASTRTRATVVRPAAGTVAGSRRVLVSAPSAPTADAADPAPLTSAQDAVSVDVPAMPVENGTSFTVSRDVITQFAADYVAGGGDPADSPRFFFGDLAVASLEQLADPAVTPDQTRLLLGNLAVSGYFGGIWLRDNLRGPATVAPSVVTATTTPVVDLSPSAIALHLFDGMATGLVGAAQSSPWIATTVAHLAVPVLLALYGYNKGYLEVVLDNPPPGAPSMADTLTCNGFLDCKSSAFPLELATRYDAALPLLEHPTTLGWAEMALWSKVLESATSAGRFVWQTIVAAGGLSPTSYVALVDLSSAYLMVSKAAVLSSMIAAADGEAGIGGASLRLQAGLWMWSGSYFAGLASSAATGTLPSVTVTSWRPQ